MVRYLTLGGANRTEHGQTPSDEKHVIHVNVGIKSVSIQTISLHISKEWHSKKNFKRLIYYIKLRNCHSRLILSAPFLHTFDLTSSNISQPEMAVDNLLPVLTCFKTKGKS